MKNIRNLAIFNALAFIIAFAVSTASQFKIFGGKDIGQVSNKFDTAFAPAGLTFSIWGVIYLSLFAFCIYHLIKAYRLGEHDQANKDLSLIGVLFIINNVGATLWVVAWLYEYLFVSVLLMLLQLATLIKINQKLEIFQPGNSLSSRLFTQFPMSIYFGWISVATVANTNALIFHNSLFTWPIEERYWTVFLIGIITLVSLYVIMIRRNVTYGLVVIWAAYGIVLKSKSVDEVLFANVIRAGWTAIIILAIFELLQIRKNIRSRQKESALQA